MQEKQFRIQLGPVRILGNLGIFGYVSSWFWRWRCRPDACKRSYHEYSEPAISLSPTSWLRNRTRGSRFVFIVHLENHFRSSAAGIDRLAAHADKQANMVGHRCSQVCASIAYISIAGFTLLPCEYVQPCSGQSGDFLNHFNGVAGASHAAACSAFRTTGRRSLAGLDYPFPVPHGRPSRTSCYLFYSSDLKLCSRTPFSFKRFSNLSIRE